MLTLNEADKLLMIPGPTPIQREILDALGEPTISHMSEPMADIVTRCLAGLRDVAGTVAAQAFVFAGAGTLAQETALVNLVEPGDRLLVLSNGFFGDRFTGIAAANQIAVDTLQAPWGTSVTPEQLEEQLSQAHYRAVTMTQVETSTGTMAPIAELAAVAKCHGVLVIVDAVCALGGVPADMDARKLDIVLSGAQKALGVPPGLTILLASQAAMERRRALRQAPGFYTDLLNWEPSMQDPQVYFSTHTVNLFYALLAGLEIIEREGLPNRFQRHDQLGRSFRAGMGALGFSSLTAPEFLSPTMSVLAYPRGVDDAAFRSILGAKGVVAAGCLGDFKGRGARFGHMGNITESDILRAVADIEATLDDLDIPVTLGSGVSGVRRAAAEPETIAP